jgi:uncharacterized membrane protein YczE
VASAINPTRRSADLPMSFPRRLLQFTVGLTLCAVAVWSSVTVGLGLSPWDTLHAGLSERLGLSFGTILILVGVLVQALAWVLGQRPGLGTLVNIVGVGWTVDRLLGTSWLDGLPEAPTALRVLVLLGSVTLLGLGGAMYIAAGFGAGPRDSLMVACFHRGLPIGPARCAIECTVLLVGWLLGGPLGLGTVLLALGTGPVVQLSFRLLRQQPPSRSGRGAARPGRSVGPRRRPR